MAKLRHVAIQVPDLEKAASFYEKSLELTRVAKRTPWKNQRCPRTTARR
jgi:catechol 2,3-dioxygenase-like lactoylglutathione lyase family enzyme